MEKEKRVTLTNQKPTKRPLSLRKVDNDDNETSSVSSVDQNDSFFQNLAKSSESLSGSNAEEMSKVQKLRDPNKKKVIYLFSEVYLEPSQTVKMELFAKIVEDWKTLKGHLRCLTGF